MKKTFVFWFDKFSWISLCVFHNQNPFFSLLKMYVFFYNFWLSILFYMYIFKIFLFIIFKICRIKNFDLYKYINVISFVCFTWLYNTNLKKNKDLLDFYWLENFWKHQSKKLLWRVAFFKSFYTESCTLDNYGYTCKTIISRAKLHAFSAKKLHKIFPKT